MKPEEALRLLDNTLAQVQLNREGHQLVMTALKTLEVLINEVKK